MPLFILFLRGEIGGVGFGNRDITPQEQPCSIGWNKEEPVFAEAERDVQNRKGGLDFGT